jgi:hypothetical protein
MLMSINGAELITDKFFEKGIEKPDRHWKPAGRGSLNTAIESATERIFSGRRASERRLFRPNSFVQFSAKKESARIQRKNKSKNAFCLAVILRVFLFMDR